LLFQEIVLRETGGQLRSRPALYPQIFQRQPTNHQQRLRTPVKVQVIIRTR
jgi:hypothetical protein